MLRIPVLTLLLCLPCVSADQVAAERAAEGWLGIYLADSRTEARVAEVIPGSPADDAGVKPGDVLVEVGGRATRTVEEFAAAAESFEAGARVHITLRRGDEELEIEVRLAARPGDVTRIRVPAFLGVAIVPSEGGVLVNEVLVDSPASAAGISPGDRIVRLHGEPVRSVDDVDRVMRRLAPGMEVAVNVQNDAGSASLLIHLGARPMDGRETAAVPGAVPTPGATGPGLGGDVEARLERAEREVERLGRELEALIALRGGLEELIRLRQELAELRGTLRELLRDR